MDQLALRIWDLLEGAEPESGYTLDALRTATGASYADVRAALLQLQDIDAARPRHEAAPPLESPGHPGH